MCIREYIFAVDPDTTRDVQKMRAKCFYSFNASHHQTKSLRKGTQGV